MLNNFHQLSLIDLINLSLILIFLTLIFFVLNVYSHHFLKHNLGLMLILSLAEYSKIYLGYKVSIQARILDTKSDIRKLKISVLLVLIKKGV